MADTKTCKKCGKTFYAKARADHGRLGSQCCSEESAGKLFKNAFRRKFRAWDKVRAAQQKPEAPEAPQDDIIVMADTKTCEQCGTTFTKTPIGPQSVYCSETCADKAFRNRRRRQLRAAAKVKAQATQQDG